MDLYLLLVFSSKKVIYLFINLVGCYDNEKSAGLSVLWCLYNYLVDRLFSSRTHDRQYLI